MLLHLGSKSYSFSLKREILTCYIDKRINNFPLLLFVKLNSRESVTKETPSSQSRTIMSSKVLLERQQCREEVNPRGNDQTRPLTYFRSTLLQRLFQPPDKSVPIGNSVTVTLTLDESSLRLPCLGSSRRNYSSFFQNFMRLGPSTPVSVNK